MQDSEMHQKQDEDASEALASLKKKDIKRRKTIQENFSFENDFLSKKKCTSFYFGINPIYQKYYRCSECIRKKSLKICKFCYENCHSVCRIDSLVQGDKAFENNIHSPKIIQSMYC